MLAGCFKTANRRLSKRISVSLSCICVTYFSLLKVTLKRYSMLIQNVTFQHKHVMKGIVYLEEHSRSRTLPVLSFCWKFPCRCVSSWMSVSSSFRKFASRPKLLNSEISLGDTAHGFSIGRRGSLHLRKFTNLVRLLLEWNQEVCETFHINNLFVFLLINSSNRGKFVKSLISIYPTYVLIFLLLRSPLHWSFCFNVV